MKEKIHGSCGGGDLPMRLYDMVQERGQWRREGRMFEVDSPNQREQWVGTECFAPTLSQLDDKAPAPERVLELRKGYCREVLCAWPRVRVFFQMGQRHVDDERTGQDEEYSNEKIEEGQCGQREGSGQGWPIFWGVSTRM